MCMWACPHVHTHMWAHTCTWVCARSAHTVEENAHNMCMNMWIHDNVRERIFDPPPNIIIRIHCSCAYYAHSLRIARNHGDIPCSPHVAKQAMLASYMGSTCDITMITADQPILRCKFEGTYLKSTYFCPEDDDICQRQIHHHLLCKEYGILGYPLNLYRKNCLVPGSRVTALDWEIVAAALLLAKDLSGRASDSGFRHVKPQHGVQSHRIGDSETDMLRV